MTTKQFKKLKEGDKIVYSAFGLIEHGTVIRRDDQDDIFIYVEWAGRPKDCNASYCGRDFIELDNETK